MQWSALAGFLLGVGMLAAAIGLGRELTSFWDWPSLLVVLGGTLAGTSIQYPLSELLKVPRLIWLALHRSELDPVKTEERVVRLAEKARREGLLSLEAEAEEEEEPFLAKAIQLVVDGVEPDQIDAILDNDVEQLQLRHQVSRGVLESMARLSPAFGMVGTLIGLIKMLSRLSDPSVIGPAMALALLTTFYGAILGYMVFQPLAGNLRLRTEQEVRYREAVREGMLALQAGENPLLIRARLRGFGPSRTTRMDAQPPEMEMPGEREEPRAGRRAAVQLHP
ncbi:MAG TPA: motility protein A [Firmicutes bacterium]|nr:motility protein A [Bacillota bacterium]